MPIQYFFSVTSMWKSWKVASAWKTRISVQSLLERVSRCSMAEEAVPSAKRQCTEERNDDWISELPNSEALVEPSSPEPREEKGAVETPASFQRIRRKKCALLLSYNGKGYLGMQLNPGTKTIERDLLEALAKAKAFPEDMKSDLGQLQFQRCSRTDKGVSAARQVVSLKIMAEEANQYLPPQIRIMGFRRVTKSFNSKTACFSRSYEYVTPTYAFAPYRLTTLDYRIDSETMATIKRLLKMYEKTHNFHNFTSGKSFDEQSANRYIISFTCGTPFVATESSKSPLPSLPSELTEGDGGKLEEDTRSELEGIEQEDLACGKGSEVATSSRSQETEQTESVGERQEGTSEGESMGNIGNGTQRKRRKREVEFLTLQVKGQSFMLHQIRKMIGLLIAIVRGFIPESSLTEAFNRNKIDIPKAPGLGLLLDNVFFEGYNKKFASDASHDALDWLECEERVQSFKKQYIYQSIVDTEISSMSMMQWLGSLQIHEFYQTRQRLALAQQQQKNIDTVQVADKEPESSRLDKEAVIIKGTENTNMTRLDSEQKEDGRTDSVVPKTVDESQI